MTRLFLGLSAVAWFPYGIYCLLDPTFLERTIGLVATTPTASTDVRAMYGGLQAGIGLLAGLALLHPTLVRPALITSAFLTAGLGSGRLLGVALDGGLSAYTIGGLVFEGVVASISIRLLRSTPSTPAT
jgi:Domain of unknown function (DUF4345)